MSGVEQARCRSRHTRVHDLQQLGIAHVLRERVLARDAIAGVCYLRRPATSCVLPPLVMPDHLLDEGLGVLEMALISLG